MHALGKTKYLHVVSRRQVTPVFSFAVKFVHFDVYVSVREKV